MNSAEMDEPARATNRVRPLPEVRHETAAVAPAQGDLAQRWARLFVRALVENGVRRFVVSPGSRSTPLALAVAAHADAGTTVVIDERSAGFVALGMARATGEPAAVICTSGTAALHLHPAIVEASAAGHPLLAITADRPWEAQGCGSPQTIDQTRLFGAHVRGFFAAGVPETEPAALRAMARIAAQAAALARGPEPGAVHVNVPFRKPLEPSPRDVPGPWNAAVAALPRAHAARLMPGDDALASVAQRMSIARRGVIIAGPRAGAPATRRERDAIARLAERTGFTLLAETTSGLRGASAIGAFDAFLRVPSVAAALRPDFVLQLGMAAVSPAIGPWLAGSRAPVVAAGVGGWVDPDGLVTEVLPGGLAEIAEALADRVSAKPDDAWRARWRDVERRAWAAVEAHLAGDPATLREGDVARAVFEALPASGWILAGNSRPVRDLDSWVPPRDGAWTVLHQRGVSGIDGLVAGAAGASLARREPGALLLGDVSLAHDIGSLAVAREVRTPLAIVAIDNGGGRIFDELPLGAREDLAAERERLFTTAPRIDWSAAARAFGIAFRSVRDRTALRASLTDALAAPGATLIVAEIPDAGLPPPRRGLHAAVRAALGTEVLAS